MFNHQQATKQALSAFVWDETLTTGIPDLDSQHQTLFQLVEQLRALRQSTLVPEQVGHLLKAFEQFSVHHFDTEEALMSQHAVSDSHQRAHQFSHQDFIQHIQRARRIALADPNSAIDFLLAFLAQWFLHHVATMDLLLVEEIKARRPGEADASPRSTKSDYKQTLIENINTVYSALGDRTFEIMELNLQLQSEIERRKEMERELVESQTRFRMMADHSHSWEYWLGPDNSVIYMSPSCLRVTGYPPEAFAADPELLYQIIHPDDRHLMDHYQKTASMQGDDADELGIRIIHRNGDTRWIIHSCQHVYGENADFLGQRISNRDITDRQLHNDSMLLVTNVFESINEGAIVTDENNRIIVVNTAFTNITGYEAEEVIGKNPVMLSDKVLQPDHVMELLSKLTTRGRWQGEIDYRRKNGERYTAAVSIDSVRDPHDNISNFIVIFSDVTNRKENELRIHYLSHHDILTGLPNWKLFSEHVQHALEAAKIKHGRFGLMFVDIDRFKQTKDRLGHEMSDFLLKIFAERLLACLPPLCVAARVGSDEFVVLLPDAEAVQQASAISENLLKTCLNPFALANIAVSISVSIGLAFYPDHGTTISQLMKKADLAVYQAKRAGGALATVYASVDSESL